MGLFLFLGGLEQNRLGMKESSSSLDYFQLRFNFLKGSLC